MHQYDQFVEQKTQNEFHAPGHLTWFGQYNESFERGNNHQVSLFFSAMCQKAHR
jgi:hypothetical protein